MKKFLIGGVAAAAMALPAIAIAQTLPAPVVSGEAKVSNSNAGTPKKPTPVKFTFKSVNSAESQTTVRRITLDLPVGVKFDGSRLPVCSSGKLANGPSACPKGSKLGTGVSYAFLVNKNLPAPKCVESNGTAGGCLTFDTTFFVGGKKLMSIWLSQRGGGVQKVMQGVITRGGRRMAIEIPADLQKPAPALYSALLQLSGSFHATKKVGKKTYSFVSTTACPPGKVWAVRTTFDYAGNPDGPPVASQSGEARQRCTK